MSDETKTPETAAPAAPEEKTTLQEALQDYPALVAALDHDPKLKSMTEDLVRDGSPVIQNLAQQLCVGLNQMLSLDKSTSIVGLMTHAAAALACANFLTSMVRDSLADHPDAGKPGHLTVDTACDFIALGAAVSSDRMLETAMKMKADMAEAAAKKVAAKAAEKAKVLDPDLAAAIFGSGNRSGPALC